MVDVDNRLQSGKSEVLYGHLQTGRSKAAVKGVFWASLNGLAPALVGAGVFTVASRYLTPSQFGLVALAASIAALVSALVPVGFSDALVQRKEIDRRHLDAVFWLCAIVSVAAYVLLVAISIPLARILDADGLALILPVVGARIIFDLLGAVPSAILSRSMSFNLMAVRTTVASLLAAAVCLVLLVLGYGIWALALSQLASSVAACMGSLLSARWRPGLSLDRRALADLKNYGLFASGNRIIQVLSLDQLMIGSLLGVGPLGLFGFSRRIFQIINDLISGPLNAVSYTLLSSLQTERKKLEDAFLSATFASAALSFPVFIGLGAIAGDLVPLVFGQHWVDAVMPLRAFCIIGMFSCIGVIQASLINSQGHASWWLYYNLSKQIVTVAVIGIFFRMGVDVLVLCLALQTILMWPATVIKTSGILGMRSIDYIRSMAPPLFSGILMLSSVLLVQWILHDAPALVRVALEIAAGAATYSGALVILAWPRLFRMRDMVFSRGFVSP